MAQLHALSARSDLAFMAPSKDLLSTGFERSLFGTKLNVHEFLGAKAGSQRGTFGCPKASKMWRCKAEDAERSTGINGDDMAVRMQSIRNVVTHGRRRREELNHVVRVASLQQEMMQSDMEGEEEQTLGLEREGGVNVEQFCVEDGLSFGPFPKSFQGGLALVRSGDFDAFVLLMADEKGDISDDASRIRQEEGEDSPSDSEGDANTGQLEEDKSAGLSVAAFEKMAAREGAVVARFAMKEGESSSQVRWMAEAVRRVTAMRRTGRRLAVFCCSGRECGPTVMAGYLTTERKMPFQEAAAAVVSLLPSANVSWDVWREFRNLTAASNSSRVTHFAEEVYHSRVRQGAKGTPDSDWQAAQWMYLMEHMAELADADMAVLDSLAKIESERAKKAADVQIEKQKLLAAAAMDAAAAANEMVAATEVKTSVLMMQSRELEKQINAFRASESQVKEQTAALEALVQRMKTRESDAVSIAKAAEQRAAAAAAELEQMQTKLAALSRELGSARGRVGELEEEIGVMREREANAGNVMHAARDKVAFVSQQLEIMKARERAAHEVAEAAAERVAMLAAKVAELEAKATSKQEASESQSKLSQTVASLTAEGEALKSQVDELNAQVQQLHSQVQQLTSELEAAAAREAELVKALEEGSGQLQAAGEAQGELEALRATAEEAARKLQEMEERSQFFASEMEESHSALLALEQDAARSIADAEAARKDREELLAEVVSMRQLVQRLREDDALKLSEKAKLKDEAANARNLLIGCTSLVVGLLVFDAVRFFMPSSSSLQEDLASRDVGQQLLSVEDGLVALPAVKGAEFNQAEALLEKETAELFQELVRGQAKAISELRSLVPLVAPNVEFEEADSFCKNLPPKMRSAETDEFCNNLSENKGSVGKVDAATRRK